MLFFEVLLRQKLRLQQRTSSAAVALATDHCTFQQTLVCSTEWRVSLLTRVFKMVRGHLNPLQLLGDARARARAGQPTSI
jgi:hypothetical protein